MDMDKENYQTFEYLPGNISENDQFFVVEDNGSIMITRQAVQYAGQAQDTKESFETVQVFNVSPQQFLVDVNNSSELITVSDEFVINEEGNNLYGNSFLLQPECSASNETMDQDSTQELEEVSVEFKQVHTNIDAADTSKATNSCTEITLTDEQYQMLEQKGWILLEIGDKIYVLNTLGLHDITTNHKLIQKLKGEGQESENQDLDIGNINSENGTFENDTEQSLAAPESPECIIENNIVINPQTPNKEDIAVFNTFKEETPNVINSSEDTINAQDCQQNDDIQINTKVFVIENEDIRRVGNMLKVKTKLPLKDFPDKLVLGKTVNGKKLIAKVIKQTVNDGDIKLANTDQGKPGDHINNNILSESEFFILLKHFFKNNITQSTAEDVVTADCVITQLLLIPSFRSSIIDNNLVITKVVHNVNSGNGVHKGLSALVTGKVTLIQDQWRFVHLPHMLQMMVIDTMELISHYKQYKKEDYDVLHVQISETKQAIADAVRISVTVNKRNIPINIIIDNDIQKLPSKMFACSFCANLFKTEIELKDHQSTHTLKNESLLTLAMEQPNNATNFYIINSGKTKTYACMQCDAKFNRQTTCKNHLKTHYTPNNEDSKEKSQTDTNNQGGIYKCNMCPSTYLYSSTLSKHIVARHIKIKN